MRLLPVAVLVLLLLPAWPVGATPAAGGVPPHAVVLLYHRFGESRYPSTNIGVRRFRRQLDYLASHGFHVWPLARIVEALRARRSLPDHTVAITVDDAYRSVYERAYPLLRAHHYPFTVFVSTEVVDDGGASFMSWAQMRAMAHHGAEFADHTVDHAYLLKRRAGESEQAWKQRVRADVTRGQERLQAELGPQTNASPRLFAYPYGEYDPALQKILRGMGYVAFGQQSGAIGPGSDFEALPRFPMAGRFATMRQFRTKIDTLPLPVRAVTPEDPLDPRHNPPWMKLTVGPGPSRAQRNRLRCYASNQGRIAVVWLDAAHRELRVHASHAFPGRRARYNCTLPAGNGRYYWYSHLWIWPDRGETDG